MFFGIITPKNFNNYTKLVLDFIEGCKKQTKVQIYLSLNTPKYIKNGRKGEVHCVSVCFGKEDLTCLPN